MNKNTKIGFDLDGIFINGPPFVPRFLIEKLYKGGANGIIYRIPGKFEQKLRVLSHTPVFRPAIKNNLSSFKQAGLTNIYLISSRFSFLKQRTNEWNRKNDLFKYFKKSYFNERDEQPHEFKNNVIKKERIEKYIDDDLDLLLYLSRKNPGVEFYWVGPHVMKLPKNITKIRDLEEFFEKYV